MRRRPRGEEASGCSCRTRYTAVVWVTQVSESFNVIPQGSYEFIDTGLRHMHFCGVLPRMCEHGEALQHQHGLFAATEHDQLSASFERDTSHEWVLKPFKRRRPSRNACLVSFRTPGGATRWPRPRATRACRVPCRWEATSPGPTRCACPGCPHPSRSPSARLRASASSAGGG